MKILIPTSGLGSRLGDFSKHTNKALIKIGDKAAISHIIDLYPEDEFVITLGYYGDHIKQFLEMAYPKRKFTFVNVDPYEGPGSGLLKSISFAQKHLQEPFIFHVCDTIIHKKPPVPVYNWMACGVSSQADLFRTVITNKDRIVKINEKGEMNYDYAYIGIAGIYDHKKFWKELDNAMNTSDSSDCHVFERMLPSTRIQLWKMNYWYDTGNVESLNITRANFQSRYRVLDKYEEAIYFIDDYVIKFFSNPEIIKNRLLRAKLLADLTPKILEQSENFYKYRLQDGDPLSEVVTEDRIFKLIDWAETNLWKPVSIDTDVFQTACKDFYLNKTKERVNKFLSASGLEDKDNNINGMHVPTCEKIYEGIDWTDLYTTLPSLFHGDFVLENILYNNDKFTLLDWRQDFGGNIEAGDIYYDLAKLNHNLVFNHAIIDNKGYHLSIDNGDIACDLHRSHNMVLYQQSLLKLLESKGYDINKIQILSAIIWLNMSALHVYPLNKFLFYFGKYNLWKQLSLTK